MAPSVTLQTVADAVGVSRTTVSNAFSRPDQLSPELRERVLAAAERLGYGGPDPAARTLRRGRAGAIGVVLTESLTWAFGDPYAVEFLRGLAAGAETGRQSLLLIPCPPGADQVEGVRNAVVDAYCCYILPDGHPVVGEVLARNVPAVFVDGPRVDGRPFIGIDDRAAMAALTQHLLDLGHTSIAVLAFRIRADGRVGPADDERIASADYRVTRQRLAGVLDTARAAGLDRSAIEVYEVGPSAGPSAYDAAGEMLDRPDRPTAIMCLSDEIALGLIDALAARGLAVPDDVSVTGFDDIAAAAPAGLTTVSQPAVRKGAAAGQVLAARAGAGDILLDHELVVRTSTGPSPARSTP